MHRAWILVSAVLAVSSLGSAVAEPVPGICHFSDDQPACEATLVADGDSALVMPVGSVRISVFRNGTRVFRRCYGGHLVTAAITPQDLRAGDVIKMASLSASTVAVIYGGPAPTDAGMGLGGETGCL